MGSESNSEIVRRVLERGFGGGDLSVVDEYVAADFIEHQDGAQGRGPAAVKGIIRGLHESLQRHAAASSTTSWRRAKTSGCA